MTNSCDITLLSIAWDIPQRTSPGFFGHEIVYQRALIDAAHRRGLSAETVAPVETDATMLELTRLHAGGAPGSWVSNLRNMLGRYEGRRVIVLFYEGSLEILKYVSQLALLHPETVFAVNLFKSDRPLAVPHLSERSVVHRRHLDRRELQCEAFTLRDRRPTELPHNVLVYADTERRAFLARSIGISGVKPWPLYSVVEPVTKDQGVQRAGPIRVVIPVAARQATRQLIYEVACVVELCSRYAPPDRTFEWYVFGGGYANLVGRHRPRARRIARLRDLGVRFEPDGLAGNQYARALARADVVWLPKRGFYTTQSSGKAADALVVGTPLLAPNGSFPAHEMDRWVSGAPAYTGVREAVEILLRGSTVFPTLRDMLVERLDEIRWWYSPDRAVAELVSASSQIATPTTHDQSNPQPSSDVGNLPTPPLPGQEVKGSGTRVVRTLLSRLAHVRNTAIEAWVRLTTVIRLR